MSTSRRNTLIRTIAALSGDFAAGFAVAAACVWLIEYAALGLFLSFLLWLLAVIVALALSQHVIHPAVTLFLSNQKLDVAVQAASTLADAIGITGEQVALGLARYGRATLSRVLAWSSSAKAHACPI
ncbi:hypothetical protein [Rhodoferax sp. PAMC 29310]|uniref:hypothetical protein n=1 Tax=Rhodoferax sp. PAMC 29310 TaxID=2822760 RepID=UPI001B3232F9|nr:hypothetical protein [Rhodoferax sp. PAMC 29310]